MWLDPSKTSLSFHCCVWNLHTTTWLGYVRSHTTCPHEVLVTSPKAQKLFLGSLKGLRVETLEPQNFSNWGPVVHKVQKKIFDSTRAIFFLFSRKFIQCHLWGLWRGKEFAWLSGMSRKSTFGRGVAKRKAVNQETTFITSSWGEGHLFSTLAHNHVSLLLG